MPVQLVNRSTGQTELVEDADVSAAIASQKYVDPGVIAVHRLGSDSYSTPQQLAAEQAYVTPVDPGKAALASGHQIREKRNSGIGSAVKAGLGAFTSGTTFGIANPWQEEQEFNPLAAGIGHVASYVAPFLLPGGAEAKAAEAIGDVTAAEHIAGSLSSSALHAGEVRAGASALEKSMIRGRGARLADEAVELTPERIAKMSGKELTAARRVEVANVQAQRVPQTQALIDDIEAHHASYMSEDRLWQALDDKEALRVAGARELGAKAGGGDRALRKFGDNPEKFAANPRPILDALTQQGNALEKIAAKETELRTALAADPVRLKALDSLPAVIERNRALQARARALMEPATSPVIETLDAAKEAIGVGRKEGLGEQLLGGKIFHVAESAATKAFGAIPFIGPMVGAKVAELAKHLVFGHGGAAIGAGIERAATLAKEFAGKAIRGPAAPILATRVLSEAAFAPRAEGPPGKTLADHFERRSAEIRSQTAYGPTGQPQMRPEARSTMADALAPLRLVSPILADRVESVKARGLEFLSSKLPRRPDMPGIGPVVYHPSDMEMRKFAQYVDAVEHPENVERRLVDGTLSPEDAEAYRAVYPERHASLSQQIVQETATSKTPIPYARRVALSIFTGVAADPTMDPMIMATFQGHFAKENNSRGGTSNPTPSPQFGSVKKSAPQPTEADKRRAGEVG